MVGMLLLSWQLALFAFALIPLFALLTRRVGNERRRIAKSTQETLADISSLVQESLSVSGILLGKTMGRGDELADRFEQDAPPRRPRGASGHGRPLGHGLDPDELRDHAGGRLLVRRPPPGERLERGVDSAAGRVHDPPDPALLPDRIAARGQPGRADLARALRPHLRVPRPAGRHRREAGRDPRGPAG